MNPLVQESAEPPEHEPQTVRALLEMRELVIAGAFKPGERIREVWLAARLGVSRTPVRLVLERLVHEGLLQARDKGGFMARQFTLQDILDVIETRGVLEGTAARLAAERLQSEAETAPMRECLAEIDRILTDRAHNYSPVASWATHDTRFHRLLIDLAKSPILRRSLEQMLGLPLASPDAFVGSGDDAASHNQLVVAQSQHRAIAEAIAERDGARAEAVAREHSRPGRNAIVRAFEERRIRQLPGGLLVRI